MIILRYLLKNSHVINTVLIVVGVSLMTIGVRCVYEPLNLVTGGVSGFAIVISHITKNMPYGGIPLWLTTAAVNLPLFIVGTAAKGKKYISRSLAGTILFTIELSAIPEINIMQGDYFLAAIIGGVFTGVGLGLVFLTSSSTGGTDLLCQIIRHYKPQYSVSSLIMIVDSVIVLMGATVFGVKNAGYAIAAVYVTSRVMDKVMTGANNAKMVTIITEKNMEISKAVMEKIGRGVTSLDAVGMYSGHGKKMLIVGVGKRQLMNTLRIIYEEDVNAFIMISDIREIIGEGFVNVDSYLE